MKNSDMRGLGGPGEYLGQYMGHPMDPRNPEDDYPDYAIQAECLLQTCDDIAVAAKVSWEWDALSNCGAAILQVLALHASGTVEDDAIVGRLVRSLALEDLENIVERMNYYGITDPEDF